MAKKSDKPSIISRATSKISEAYAYFTTGVWKDPRTNFKTRIVKTLNLTVGAFSNSSLQNKSMSLTYSTVLSIVPALALLLAIGRGFGLQNLLQDELYSIFPAQRRAIETALSFVDSYLSQASQGIFVGVGIVVLLWTLISLLSQIEMAFNSIWDIRRERSMYQKITDYISICLLIPVLMICSSGISIFMSTTIQNNIQFSFLTPVFNACMEATPLVLAWLAFTFSYWLIPNTKVSFKYAAISGALCAVGFQIVQLLFVNGQIYVSKYNAIYGSFSFLPLMLVWIQISWLILLTGCVLTYSLQNVFTIDYMGKVEDVSLRYTRYVSLIVCSLIFRRFTDGKTPLTANSISSDYGLPLRLVKRTVERLREAGVVYLTVNGQDDNGLTPAVEPRSLTVGQLLRRLDDTGQSDFIPGFRKNYASLIDEADAIFDNAYGDCDSLMVADLPLPQPQKGDS